MTEGHGSLVQAQVMGSFCQDKVRRSCSLNE